MPFVADLHIHSKYSRACSRDCDLEHLAWWAARKGIALVGTGDMVHPAYSEQIRDRLVPAEPGLFRLRPDLEAEVLRTLPPSCRTPVRFMLSVEISTIYKRDEQTRKVHHLLYAPDLDSAGRLTAALARVGNIASDGRPILGLDSRDLLEITLAAGAGCYLVPAHIWTPWFAALGSKSGFDAIADCYADLAEEIFAVETGLSSDPLMNWRVSSLDRYRLVSNSDAHSPPALGREATVFSSALDYFAVLDALRTGAGLDGTIEFFPEEGKYHTDGHRRCDVRLDPAETRARGGRCPACGTPLTVGVLHRVEALADRPAGFVPDGSAGYTHLVQLPEIVGEIHRVGPRSKRVVSEVDGLVARLGPELSILRHVPTGDIAAAGGPLLAEALGRLRRGEVIREAGYDGEYGVIRLFEPKELADAGGDGLFDLPAAPKPRARRAAEPAGGVVPDGALDLPGLVVPRKPAEDTVHSGPKDLLSGLDPEQRRAAEITAGPLLIVAGPGTGKTRTLTHRIAHLVRDEGVDPEHCLAITFTRRAAEELRERLTGLLGAAARVPVTTFHALGLRILREQAQRAGLTPDFRIAADTERLALLRAAFGEPASAGRDPRRLLAEVSRLARSAAGEQGAIPSGVDDDLAGPLARYRANKRAANLVDLDDLLVLPVTLLEADPDLAGAYRCRWPHVSVDEYQDVDDLQYRLLRQLVPPAGNLCAIGDPDQAIYGFRGADVGFFLRFAADYPGARTVTLTRNYRSSTAIVAAAVDLIRPGTLVPGRELTAVAANPDAPATILVHAAADERAEASWVVGSIDRMLGGRDLLAVHGGRAQPRRELAHSFAEIAVLYRTDAQARALVEALEAAGMPYQKRSHHRLSDQPGVQEVLAILRADLAAGGAERTVLARVRAAGQAAIDAAGGLPALAAAELAEPVEFAETYGDVGTSAVAAIRTALELLTPLAERSGADAERFLSELALGAEVDVYDPRADRIALLTLHAAKGLEFPVVFMLGVEDGLLPLTWSGTADVAEERRLAFVGVTRARDHLLLSQARRRTWRGTVREPEPSRFLSDVRESLVDTDAGPARRRTVQLRLL
jgi:DNA helicase II / ATP-dependent DNA helicase PcrA